LHECVIDLNGATLQRYPSECPCNQRQRNA
jgi:ABC-type microcin C transport system duplicated ATPase subunit YejF